MTSASRAAPARRCLPGGGRRPGHKARRRPATINEFLHADLVDHLHIVLIPIVLGRGVWLWEGLDGLHERYSRKRSPFPAELPTCSSRANALQVPGDGLGRDLAADRTRRHRVWTTSWGGRHASCPASRNVIVLMGFGIYLIVLPLFGVLVSDQAELTGAN